MRGVLYTCVADTGVVDFDTDLVGLGRGNFDILDAQGLTGLPGDGGLASNGLQMINWVSGWVRVVKIGSRLSRLRGRRATPQWMGENRRAGNVDVM